MIVMGLDSTCTDGETKGGVETALSCLCTFHSIAQDCA
jgi:hypothetical protein